MYELSILLFAVAALAGLTMPQLVCTVTPRVFSMRSISAGGNAAPPTITRSSVASSMPVVSTCQNAFSTRNPNWRGGPANRSPELTAPT